MSTCRAFLTLPRSLSPERHGRDFHRWCREVDQRQSTLILFADGTEAARNVGDTSRAGVAAMLDLAL